ncbi:unnamed protein product [Ceutorhynchus assimilis]|uniref:WH2 domain-containing protein n=1 Tax=Ceutorhynchus assimilis TaxID=467358 RepID=A0A9N9MDN2_9CUCU|nr:unnamed protein product [Ceutorhynchus assimilis]
MIEALCSFLSGRGAKLKKTVTVDKSAPMIPGKTGNSAASQQTTSSNSSSNSTAPSGMPLAGLFAGGMPKLKATGRPGASTLNTSSNNNSESEGSAKVTATPKNFGSVQDQLKRQLTNPSDTRTRGPPPPAPMRHISADDSRPAAPIHQRVLSATSSNGLHLIHGNVSSLHPNVSTLHRKSKSNANLSSLDCTDNSAAIVGGFQPSSKPVINHGKPNLAPKPPTLNGKPAPPTKLSVKTNRSINRAQSMRSPRSPSPAGSSPIEANSIKFGTVRNMSSIIGQSLTNLNSQPGTPSIKQRPQLTTRPTVPPPSVPPPAAPSPKVASVKPPSHAPPPPPGGLPQPPVHAPPPPPHKTQQSLPQPSRPPPAIPTNNINNNNNNVNPPPPPPRHSSMRDVNNHHQPPRRTVVDLEEKFRSAFCTPDRFPRPPPYRNVLKLYSNRQASISKQQAPQPPHQLQLQPVNKLWNATSTC